MRKIMLLAVASVAALSLATASAGEGPTLPIPNSCNFVGGAATDGEGSLHCEFEAADVPAHGYVGATPNDFAVFLDANDNDVLDDGEAIVEVSPSGFDAVGGQLALDAGTTYDVVLFEGCVQSPGCGWIGALLVG